MFSLKSTTYKIGYPIMKMYWFFRRPTSEGVRCLIINGDKILLIRHTYGSPLWTTAGGGIKQRETYEQAVLREVEEEIGITLTKIAKIGEVGYEGEFKHDTIHIFLSETTATEIVTDNAEILEAKWYPLDDLPENISPLFKQFFKLAISHSPQKFGHL